MITELYKQTQRPQRQISTEQGFSKGMFYKNTPIPEGYGRLLVNFDIDSISGAVRPRKGYTNGNVAVAETAGVDTTWYGTHINKVFKHNVNAPDVYGTLRPTDFIQVMTGNPTTENVAWVSKLRRDNLSKYSSTQISKDRVIDTVFYNGWIRNAGRLTTGYARIFGKQISGDFFAKPVCCQAFNNNLYFIQRLVPDEGETISRISYTKYKRDVTDSELPNRYVEGPTEGYDAFEVVPYEPTPSEAASWGVNMLLADPYNFACEDGADVAITGVLAYDPVTDVTVLMPRRGQTLKMKGYFRAPAAFHSATEASLTVATFDAGDAETYADLPAASPLIADGTYYYVVALTAHYVYYNNRWNHYDDTTDPLPATITVYPDGAAEDSVRVVWDWREVGSSTWTTFKDTTVLLSDQDYEPFTAELTMPTKNILIRLTITDPKDITKTVSGEDIEYVLSTLTTGITVLTDDVVNNLNLEATTYDLGTAQGMTMWEQRLVLWGVKGAENTIFVSDVNNPGYFPYPNNVDIFKEPVLNVLTHGQTLIVFTGTSIIKLTWKTDGTSWTKSVLQQHLQFTPEDKIFMLSVRGMLFYKHGSYFYMLVPTTVSNPDELTVAPISNNIKILLDNIFDNLYQVLVDTYPDREVPFIGRSYKPTPSSSTIIEETLTGAGVYLENTDIVVWFEHTLDNSSCIYVELRYNIDARTWRVYTYDTPVRVHMLGGLGLLQNAYDNEASKVLQEELITHIYPIRNDMTGAITDGAFHFLKKGSPTVDNIDGGYLSVSSSTNWPFVVYEEFEHTLANYQLLDTGARNFNSITKRRFRELQFTLKNHTKNALTFLNDIYVDDVLRKTPYKQEPVFDEATNQVIITEVLQNTTHIAGDPIINAPTYVPDGYVPVDTADDSLPSWELGYSKLTENASWTIRIPYSGKGLTTRTVIKSLNEKDYEILNLSWVYRVMNAR